MKIVKSEKTKLSKNQDSNQIAESTISELSKIPTLSS